MSTVEPRSIVPATIVFPHPSFPELSFVNHGSDAAFPTWIVKKNFEAKYLLFALPSLWTINLAALITNNDSCLLRLP